MRGGAAYSHAVRRFLRTRAWVLLAPAGYLAAMALCPLGAALLDSPLFCDVLFRLTRPAALLVPRGAHWGAAVAAGAIQWVAVGLAVQWLVRRCTTRVD